MQTSEIQQVRAFNRFYTRVVGLLDEGLNDSAYTLTEARVLYELAHATDATATTLCCDLGLDPGYLSRILKGFERARLVSRAPSPNDGRQSMLGLTKKGRSTFAGLDQRSNASVAALLDRLDETQRSDVQQAMDTLRANLSGLDKARSAILLRAHRPGDMGWITHRQAILYHEEYGWDGTYEALISEIMARFVREFDAEKERAWIAEQDGRIVGSVFLVRQSDSVAKLRLLYVEPTQRGSGLGRRLVEECIGFARAKGYEKLTLWTNDILIAARRIYETRGFRLVAEEPHTSFGKKLVGQTWELDLRPAAPDNRAA